MLRFFLQDMLNSEVGRSAFMTLMAALMSRPAFWIGNLVKARAPEVFHKHIPMILAGLGVLLAGLATPIFQSLAPMVDFADMFLSALIGTGLAKMRHDTLKIKTLKGEIYT